MVSQKFTNFDNFLIILSKKIVLNEVKDSQALLELSYGEKLSTLFGQPNICTIILHGRYYYPSVTDEETMGHKD